MTETAPFRSRVVLVTGAGQGIGKGIATHLLTLDDFVVIADVDGEAIAEIADGYAKPDRILTLTADVSSEPAVERMIETTISRFGRLDALINNAGIAAPHSGPLEELSLSNWNRVIATNLTGVFLCSKHAVPFLRVAKGAIVNIASTRAFQSEADTEAYAASKGGIVALTHAMAVSLGPQIRVNCISPGWIAVEEWKKQSLRTRPDIRPRDHGQHPVGRVGRPEDIAEMAEYLISSRAGFITGQNFVVDGGMTRKMIYAE